MSGAKVIELQRMLAEKFPKIRDRARTLPGHDCQVWATGLRQIDDACGGLAKGGITEIVSEKRHCGSATLIHALLHRGACDNRIIAVIDASDSLDVTQIENDILRRLLWVRCRSAEEAMKAADLILRDNNLPLVVADFISINRSQLRNISPTAWYRFQRLLETTSTVCVVFTPWQMIAPAAMRLTLRSQLSLSDLEKPRLEVLGELDIAAVKNQHGHDATLQTLAG